MWSTWDLKLVQAHYINELFEVDGHPIHVEESRDIIWTAERRTVRSAAAVEAEQDRISSGSGKNHGVRVVAVPKLRDGAKWPTRAAWAKGQEEAKQPMDKMAALAKIQEEKARIKLIEMGLETAS